MQSRQGTGTQLADHRPPGITAMLPGQDTAVGQDMAAGQAVIAAARARARRRRQKIALALTAAAAVLSAAGVLFALTVPGRPHHAGAPATAQPAIRTGTVTGHFSACIGPLILPGRPLPVDPGTVTVIRGKARHSQQSTILPRGPVIAWARIRNNYRQPFRFSLPPGTYVLIGHYGETPYIPGTYGPYAQVSVIAGKTLNADIPDDCS
jgi:hypothetical protein